MVSSRFLGLSIDDDEEEEDGDVPEKKVVSCHNGLPVAEEESSWNSHAITLGCDGGKKELIY